MIPKIYPRTVLKSAKLVTGKLGGKKIRLKFPFDLTDIALIKTLPERKYDAENKIWSCPVNIETIEKLKQWGFNLDEELTHILNTSKLNINDLPEITIPGLRYPLYPYQSVGVNFIEQKKGRCLIADEMGLGKTVQALAWLVLRLDVRPCVIVVPASLKLNWARECHRWLPSPNIQILSGQKPYHITGRILIINYDILSYWIDILERQKVQVIIADEAQMLKNSKTKRSNAFKKLSKYVPHLIGLSGTPIENRPIEIYNICKIINPTVLPDYFSFGQRFCNAKYNGFSWDFSGAKNTKELNELLTSTIMLRRLKKDVLKDLPEKTKCFIPIEIDNESEYKHAESDLVGYITKTKGEEAAARAESAQVLAEIETLKQVAVRGKMKAVISWIEDFLETDEKIVIFVEHLFVVDALYNHFKMIAVKVDGSVSKVSRQHAVDEFQTNPLIKVFIGNAAAETGLTLTAASNLAFVEYPWTPGKLAQRMDRVHRITQKFPVTIHFLIAVNTIEEKICALLDEKMKVVTGVLDGVDVEQSNLLSDLIKFYKNGKS